MKHTITINLFVVLFSSCLFSQQGFLPNYNRTEYLQASPGAMKFGLYGYDNPALLTTLHQPDILYMWNEADDDWNNLNKWGLFAAVPNFGFGMNRQKANDFFVTDYRLAVGMGDRESSIGFSYGWSGGDAEYFNRTNVVSLGMMSRQNQYLSLGAVGSFASRGDGKEVVVDVAVRPRGDEVVALFADAALPNDQRLKDFSWSAGAVIEPLPGVRITGRYFDTKAFTVGFDFSFGRVSVMEQGHFDKDNNYLFSTHGIRLGAFDRTIFGTTVAREKKYVEMNFNGTMKYRGYKFFDSGNKLSDVLKQIKAAEDDPNVTGIVISTSGMEASREMLWEVREQLKEFKSRGKRVIVFIDNVGIDQYHFASIADKIVIDPLGIVTLEGFRMGRTFYKGMLDKLGIGFDEWRFFKYKSANEGYSREKMSEGDREQRQKLVDDMYALVKTEICEARKISPERFDNIVNDSVLFLASDALNSGLVDTVGRWDIANDIIKSLEGEELRRVNPGSLAKFQLPSDNRWGEPPRIAVVYALGVCAMDEGIKARSLSKVIQAVADADRVKAIILRVDSPGGDAMASDYVAEALKKCKGKKPVIISQGNVAASGGYWISMYGDTIVAAPNTITGSIGVIGGWFYNKGLKDTLGMTTDLVKAGKHADLGFGFSLPFFGMGIPDRNLSEEERAKIEHLIKSAYKEFVAKVASGREMKHEDIEAIAQGRVWSGTDGKKNGLVDVLGGLTTAIRIAKERAGLTPDEEVEIVELPEMGWFDFSSLFQPKLLPVKIEDDPALNHLLFRLKHNGEPMPILPMEFLEGESRK
ncbi:MAG: signal peptide peptidase SppA [Ignavibacteriae bacterium]|nr:signal peptide peptidase SppA [Ignavibacteriota bacterium]